LQEQPQQHEKRKATRWNQQCESNLFQHDCMDLPRNARQPFTR
jgi:hypothetical protein